jgi:hypothetical protein
MDQDLEGVVGVAARHRGSLRKPPLNVKASLERRRVSGGLAERGIGSRRRATGKLPDPSLRVPLHWALLLRRRSANWGRMRRRRRGQHVAFQRSRLDAYHREDLEGRRPPGHLHCRHQRAVRREGRLQGRGLAVLEAVGTVENPLGKTGKLLSFVQRSLPLTATNSWRGTDAGVCRAGRSQKNGARRTSGCSLIGRERGLPWP